MEINVGNYIIIDKHHENLEDLKKQEYLNLIFRFIDHKTIEILEWDSSVRRNKIKSYYPYNEDPITIISLQDGEKCKKRYLDEKFIEFLEKKDKNTIKNFYESKRKYESLLKKRIKDSYTYHFVSFNNISFTRMSPSVYNGLVYFRTLLDGKSKKNSFITHFYYKKRTKEYYVRKTDLYIQLVALIDLIMAKFGSSGFNKYDFYFDIYTTYYKSIYSYWFHCVPMEPKPIDNEWFYVFSFYTSVLFDYIIKNDTHQNCHYYDENLFHKDMDCYDIMNILIEKNNIGQ